VAQFHATRVKTPSLITYENGRLVGWGWRAKGRVDAVRYMKLGLDDSFDADPEALKCLRIHVAHYLTEIRKH